jgi:hypothetical protein
MKLTTVTNVSVDGVIQRLGGPDEDRKYVASTTLPDAQWADTTVDEYATATAG